MTDAAQRNAQSLAPTGGDEMAAMAWSYAALVHLKLDPGVVFHSHGYKGGAQSLIDAFNEPGGPGIPLLQTYGMTVDHRNAAARGVDPYPHMIRWLR